MLASCGPPAERPVRQEQASRPRRLRLAASCWQLASWRLVPRPLQQNLRAQPPQRRAVSEAARAATHFCISKQARRVSQCKLGGLRYRAHQVLGRATRTCFLARACRSGRAKLRCRASSTRAFASSRASRRFVRAAFAAYRASRGVRHAYRSACEGGSWPKYPSTPGKNVIGGASADVHAR